MTIPKMPFNFNAFVKYPLQAVCFILLAYFVYKEFRKKDECSDLRSIISKQEKRIVKLESDKDNLTNSLLVKNGIIDEIKKSTDSLIREKVGNEAKKIVQ
ncbi:hypothetical protein [Pedobacter sp.]